MAPHFIECPRPCWHRASYAGYVGYASWKEPSAALVAGLHALNWSIYRNTSCARASRWPHLDPEPTYSGDVILTPQDDDPLVDAVWTDGSIRKSGGAAVVQMSTNVRHLCQVTNPRSSTQCELVALAMVSLIPPLLWSCRIHFALCSRSQIGRANLRRPCCPVLIVWKFVDSPMEGPPESTNFGDGEGPRRGGHPRRKSQNAG